MRASNVLLRFASALALVCGATQAVPMRHHRRDAAPTTTSSSEIASFVVPGKFAAAAYCINLTPGSAIGPDGTVLYAAGNGRDIQRVFVAHSTSLGIVVAYQGTNTSSINSIENDINAAREDADSRLQFLGSDVTIDRGFQGAWLDTADEVLSEVQSAFTTYPNAPLTVVGHSLGASIALLSSAYLNHHVAPSSSRTVLFGMPRTGNDNFANGIDAHVPNQRHIINYRDPVPHLPGKTLGYQHPSGEVWIRGDSDNDVVSCGGQENENCMDSVHYYEYKESNHDGPYFGVQMNC